LPRGEVYIETLDSATDGGGSFVCAVEAGRPVTACGGKKKVEWM
jgi:hypothetical protein